MCLDVFVESARGYLELTSWTDGFRIRKGGIMHSGGRAGGGWVGFVRSLEVCRSGSLLAFPSRSCFRDSTIIAR